MNSKIKIITADTNREQIEALLDQKELIDAQIRQLRYEELHPPIQEYPDFESVEFTMLDTLEPYNNLNMTRKVTMHFIVAGKEYTWSNQQEMPDFQAIASGVQDIDADTWIIELPKIEWKEDMSTEDRAIVIGRFERYKGGLRDNLRMCPQELKDAYTRTHVMPKRRAVYYVYPVAMP